MKSHIYDKDIRYNIAHKLQLSKYFILNPHFRLNVDKSLQKRGGLVSHLFLLESSNTVYLFEKLCVLRFPFASNWTKYIPVVKFETFIT